jgi:dihydroorotase
MLRTTQSRSLLIRGARVIDPILGRDEIADISIVDGLISQTAPRQACAVDASGLIVCPGLMDIHVHLREPGQTDKETIETGTAAAAAGGFTFVACMPNTKPPLDRPDLIAFVRERAKAANQCEVGPIATVTAGSGGNELTDFARLSGAGAVAFSDDGVGVGNDSIMRAALAKAREIGTVVVQHCDYKSITGPGVMHLGEVARRANLPGIDPRSEETMIERDIALCRETRGRYHVAHISTARSVELVRQAKAEGVPVTAEVCPHHLALTHEACAGADPNTKMNPPLRTENDVDACRRGLVDGTIDCIVTDHAPHTATEKATGFAKAPPGVVGLETAVGVAARAMIASDLADWPRLIGWFTAGPSSVLGRPGRGITLGMPAELTLLDPENRWVVRPEQFVSKGRNTPFSGWELPARAMATVRGMRVSFQPEFARKLAEALADKS